MRRWGNMLEIFTSEDINTYAVTYCTSVTLRYCVIAFDGSRAHILMSVALRYVHKHSSIKYKNWDTSESFNFCLWGNAFLQCISKINYKFCKSWCTKNIQQSLFWNKKKKKKDICSDAGKESHLSIRKTSVGTCRDIYLWSSMTKKCKSTPAQTD